MLAGRTALERSFTMASTEETVSAFFDQLGDVWRSNDGAEFAAFFTEDGSLINPFGERADGREAVAAMYTEYFAGMLHGTTTRITLTHLRPVGHEWAFADADQTVVGAGGDELLALHVVNLLRRHGDGWRLADSRPYTFPPPPA
jgi:uncharacterized protein (TIGR02246 family)